MNPNQNDDQQLQGGQPVSPQGTNQADDQQQPGYQGPATVTPHGKEAGPQPAQQGEVRDYVQPAAHEAVPELPREVEQAGVEVTPQQDSVKLTSDQKAAGMQPAKESVPVSLSPQAVIQAPMTYQQAEEAAKGKADDSRTWLGNLVAFVFGKEQAKKAA